MVDVKNFVDDLMNKIIPKNGWFNGIGFNYRQYIDATFYDADEYTICIFYQNSKLVGFVNRRPSSKFFRFRSVIYPFNYNIYVTLFEATEWVERRRKNS